MNKKENNEENNEKNEKKSKIENNISEIDVLKMSPLVWAYIGDSIYEIMIRERIVRGTNTKPHKLHLMTIRYVNAKMQSKILFELQEKDILTEEEKDVLRRARNTKNYHLPKNATVKEYAFATALEAIIGYNYLLKKDDRNNIIFEEIFKILGI